MRVRICTRIDIYSIYPTVFLPYYKYYRTPFTKFVLCVAHYMGNMKYEQGNWRGTQCRNVDGTVYDIIQQTPRRRNPAPQSGTVRYCTRPKIKSI